MTKSKKTERCKKKTHMRESFY